MGEWINCKDMIPPERVVVETKIDDTNGLRNEQHLMRFGKSWLLPDQSMYVYYSPTHWRYIGV